MGLYFRRVLVLLALFLVCYQFDCCESEVCIRMGRDYTAGLAHCRPDDSCYWCCWYYCWYISTLYTGSALPILLVARVGGWCRCSCCSPAAALQSRASV